MRRIDHVRRWWSHGVVKAMGGFGASRRLPWGAIGLGGGSVLGLIGLVLAIAWFLGPEEGPRQADSRVAAGIPLPSADAGARPVGRPAPGDPVAEANVRPGLGLSVPAVAAAAFEAVPAVTVVQPLDEAPLVDLLEPVNGQMLPRVAADGRRAWQVYARPFDRKDDRPRVALIIGGLGLSRAATEASIERLPGPVTLAFDPAAEETAMWTRQARRNGHETLATLPLREANFPFHDSGPQTLVASESPAANIQRLADLLADTAGAVGVLAIGGSAFNRSNDAASPTLQAIKARGLLFVDATGLTGPSLVTLAAKLDMPRLQVDVMLDDEPDPAAIDEQLARLVQIAGDRLVGVGLGRPLPLTFARIQAWAAQLDAAGLVLVPVSAVVGSQLATP